MLRLQVLSLPWPGEQALFLQLVLCQCRLVLVLVLALAKGCR